MDVINKIYKTLHKQYGPQGWWPLFNAKTGKFEYHKGDYSLPKNDAQRFEICVGAILTQNTSWVQAEKALLNLEKINALSPNAILKMSMEKLSAIIKPSGYFRQKAKKLKEFTKFYNSLNSSIPKREELLSVWGIGNETADSMLLYSFKVPTFVVDSYTKRIVSSLGLISAKDSYDEIKAFFEKNLKPDIKIYQEYHALIVEHAKHHYSKKPYGSGCFLRKG